MSSFAVRLRGNRREPADCVAVSLHRTSANFPFFVLQVCRKIPQHKRSLDNQFPGPHGALAASTDLATKMKSYAVLALLKRPFGRNSIRSFSGRLHMPVSAAGLQAVFAQCAVIRISYMFVGHSGAAFRGSLAFSVPENDWPVQSVACRCFAVLARALLLLLLFLLLLIAVLVLSAHLSCQAASHKQKHSRNGPHRAAREVRTQD
jgi:hypothetical protein